MDKKVIALGAIGFLLTVGLGWAWYQQVQAKRELSKVRAISEQRLQRFEERVERAERRAVEAEAAAEASGEVAEQARSTAEEAEQRARWAEQESTIAKQMRDTALEARQRAEQRAADERKRAEAALAEATEAYESSTAAQREARQARTKVEELRKRNEADLDRLHGALGELAETRRTALGVVMNLGQGVEFDLDRAELRPENRELLARIAGVLLSAGDYHIQVFGHTDDQGDHEYNQQLSERRAQAVVQYLVESGIDRSILSARGLGETQPLAKGTSEEARQRNRRVEIAVVSYDEDFVPDEESSP